MNNVHECEKIYWQEHIHAFLFWKINEKSNNYIFFEVTHIFYSTLWFLDCILGPLFLQDWMSKGYGHLSENIPKMMPDLTFKSSIDDLLGKCRSRKKTCRLRLGSDLRGWNVLHSQLLFTLPELIHALGFQELRIIFRK